MQNTNPFDSLNDRLTAIESSLAMIAAKETPQAERKFYSIADASQKLGVAQITLYRQVEAGTIPFKRIGSRVMIPGSFVDK